MVTITTPAYGLDINNIVTKQCQMHAGVFISVNEIEVKLISLDGQVHTIAVNDIDTIFTYGRKINPFAQFNLQNESYQHLKEVYFDLSQDQPDVIGWAVKFVEDLVFFYSLQGKMHVLSIDQIGKIRPYHDVQKILSLDYQPVQLEVSDYLVKCNFKSITNDAITIPITTLRPVRILSDQIKIGQFLDNFSQGQQNLDNFEERTYLYAKPYLYPKRNRLSLPFFKKNLGLDYAIPFAYVWSSGSDYHFQSNTGIGAQISENLPYIGPVSLLRSDFKSHFFSGSFEGNIMGLSAGEFPEATFATDETSDANKPHAIESFNYLAIMGADYGPYSLGFGSYYPVHQITFNQQNKRGVLAHKMTPLLRFTFTLRQLKLRVLTAKTKYQFSRDELSDQLIINNSFGGTFDESFAGVPIDHPNDPTPSFADLPDIVIIDLNNLTDYQFNSRFVRIGGEFDINAAIKIMGDLVYTTGNYQESAENITNTLAFKNTAMSIGVQHAFSYYVNLKLFYQVLKRNNTGTFNGKSIDSTMSISTIGGNFELLF